MSTALGGSGRVAHRLIKERRAEAPPVVQPGDEAGLGQVGSAAAEAILDEAMGAQSPTTRREGTPSPPGLGNADNDSSDDEEPGLVSSSDDDGLIARQNKSKSEYDSDGESTSSGDLEF